MVPETCYFSISASFCLQIEAEEVPEVSMKYEIEAVPTVIMVHQGKPYVI